MPEEEQRRGREGGRFPSQRLRAEVLERDGQQCTFVADDGTRCTCRKGLQIDHIQPWSVGGATELSNLRVVCFAHNQLLARKYFGDEHFESLMKQAQPDECGRPTWGRWAPGAAPMDVSILFE